LKVRFGVAEPAPAGAILRQLVLEIAEVDGCVVDIGPDHDVRSAKGRFQVAEQRLQDVTLLGHVERHGLVVLEGEVGQHHAAVAARIVHHAADVEHRLHPGVKVSRTLRFQVDVVDTDQRPCVGPFLPAFDRQREILGGACRFHG
jgi:hypothetical protein